MDSDKPRQVRRGVPEKLARPRRARARKSGPDTLTLQKFNEAISETLHRFDGEQDYPARDVALAKRRDAAEKGDLMALYSALEWCYLDLKQA